MGFFIHSAFSLLYHSATSLTGHSARRACPELQNPHFKNQRKTFSLGEKVPDRADEGGLTRTCPHTVNDVPSSPGGWWFIHVCGFCDFAFGFAQNDRGWGHTVKMEDLGLEEPTKREFGVMGIGFLLMPGTLVF